MPVQPCALLLPPTTPRLATPPPVRAEGDVADVVVAGADDLADHDAVAGQRAAAAGRDLGSVKHAAVPHGPLGSMACAYVFRLSRSLLATRTIRIDVSSSYTWSTRFIRVALAAVTLDGPK